MVPPQTKGIIYFVKILTCVLYNMYEIVLIIPTYDKINGTQKVTYINYIN